MTTPRIRAIVSLAATLTAMLALGACAQAGTRPGTGDLEIAEARSVTIKFVNDEREYVHVYLIGERREWVLGRVEPGARATLRIPDESLAEGRGVVRLAVLSGGRLALQAARDPRARITVAQPASEILSQEWRFSQGQVLSLRARGAWVRRP